MKRRRGAGWQYVLKRKGLLPKPVYLTFRDEVEGDEYVARLEALLARGIVPVEIASDTGPGYLRASLQNYLNTTEVSALDREQLEIIANSVRWDLRLAD
ncbi:MAG: site-specific integrase, partial [Steroidobacteraceae bacterium]